VTDPYRLSQNSFICLPMGISGIETFLKFQNAFGQCAYDIHCKTLYELHTVHLAIGINNPHTRHKEFNALNISPDWWLLNVLILIKNISKEEVYSLKVSCTFLLLNVCVLSEESAEHSQLPWYWRFLFCLQGSIFAILRFIPSLCFSVSRFRCLFGWTHRASRPWRTYYRQTRVSAVQSSAQKLVNPFRP
jgi:hypothetical protein